MRFISSLIRFTCADDLGLITLFIARRAIKMNLANEGLEARKKEEEVSARKRKAEEDKNWEGENDAHDSIHALQTELHHLRKPRASSRQLAGIFEGLQEKEEAEDRSPWLGCFRSSLVLLWFVSPPSSPFPCQTWNVAHRVSACL